MTVYCIYYFHIFKNFFFVEVGGEWAGLKGLGFLFGKVEENGDGLDGYPKLGTVVKDTSTNTDIGKDSKPTEYDE